MQSCAVLLVMLWTKTSFFSPFLECAPRYLECGMGIILKDSKERRKFDFEGNAVTQFGGKHREDTVSSEFKSRVGESQKHLTGGTWKLNRVVGVSDVRRSQAMRGFVNKQEALEIDSTPHWQLVERSYQRCNMISFFVCLWGPQQQHYGQAVDGTERTDWDQSKVKCTSLSKWISILQCLRKKNLFYCQQLKEILLRIGCPQSVWWFHPSWDWGHNIVEYHQQSSERRYRVYWWFDPKQALSDCQVWACTARSAGPLSKAPRWWRSKCSSQSTCDILVATSIIYMQSGFIMFSRSPFSLELVCH